MIIKSFTASSAAGALKLARHEMGADAIVLRTTEISAGTGRGGVEVTACLERPTVQQSSVLLAASDKPHPTASSNPAKVDSCPVAEPVSPHVNGLDRWREILVDSDLPLACVDQLLTSVSSGATGQDTKSYLLTQLAATLKGCCGEPIQFTPGDRIVVVGPAGAGKSSVLGKLAASIVVDHRLPVALMTLDNAKVGSFDELAGYAAALDARIADRRLDRQADQPSKEEITLIDSPAVSDDQTRLKSLIEAVSELHPTHIVAVFSALTRSADAVKQAETLTALTPTQVVMTMGDVTHRLGAIIPVTQITKCNLALLSNTPGGIGQLQRATPELLAQAMINQEVLSE